METDDTDRGLNAFDAVVVLETELMSRGFFDVPLLNGITWGTTVNTRFMRAEPGTQVPRRAELFALVRRCYQSALAAWAQNPDTCYRMIDTVDRLLDRRIDEELGRRT